MFSSWRRQTGYMETGGRTVIGYGRRNLNSHIHSKEKMLFVKHVDQNISLMTSSFTFDTLAVGDFIIETSALTSQDSMTP